MIRASGMQCFCITVVMKQQLASTYSGSTDERGVL